MAFLPRVGTLAYLWDRAHDRVLLIRRNARPSDDHYGKVNGLGGKLETGESVIEGLRRELREDATVELTSFCLRGTITWSNFGPQRENWLGFVFLVDGWTGTPPSSNPEGDLEWADRRHLLAACDDAASVPAAIARKFHMWPGARYFVPLVFDDDPRPFHGTMPYDGDHPTDWRFERLPSG